MTDIIGIEPADHSQAVIDRVSSLLANKGVKAYIAGAGESSEGGGGFEVIEAYGMANKRIVHVLFPSQRIPEEEIEPRSISIANEVEAAIRQARDPEVVE